MAVDGAESTSLRLGDVADVVEDHQLLIGDAVAKDDRGLLLVVERFPGSSVSTLTRDVEAALDGLRPGLAGDRSGIDFNVSHTRDVALIGIAHTRRIGVDVERADRDVRADGLARKFLTSAEQATLAPLPEAERRARFLRYWTCKEAMSKATGDGLSAPMRRLEVRLTDGIELTRGPAPYEPARWRLHAVDVPDGYLATLALWSSS